MCRSANVVSIKYNHMVWRKDSLCIYFAHQKNNPREEKPKDPRQVYPNPIMPEMCPILSLELLWLTYSFDTNSNSLFPGNNQYDRCRKILGGTPHEDISTYLLVKNITDRVAAMIHQSCSYAQHGWIALMQWPEQLLGTPSESRTCSNYSSC